MGLTVQEWTLDVGGRVHRVVAREHSWTTREVVWRLDDVVVASKKSTDDRVVLTPGDAIAGEEELRPAADLDPGLGAMRVVFSAMGAPRRAVWFHGREPDVAAHVGVGGVDLEPVPGSPVAERDARAARHPCLYAARHVAAGIAKVVFPILGVWLLARLAGLLPDVSVDLPAIPWPDIDLPSIPWPDIDLPAIPWPDWELPGWVRRLRESAKFVVPILIGIALARNEIRRRKEQPAKRAELRRRADQEADPE